MSTYIPPICNVCGNQSVIVVYIGKDMRKDKNNQWYLHGPKRVGVSWVCGGTYRNKFCKYSEGLRRPIDFHGWNYLGTVQKFLLPNIDDFLFSHQLHDNLSTPWIQSIISKEQFDKYVQEWLDGDEYHHRHAR